MAKNKKILYTAVAVAGIIIVLGTLVALNFNQILQATGLAKTTPVFTFNESKARSWWAAENHNSKESVQEAEYQGTTPVDKLPIAGMTVFKGQEGEYSTACFVMFSYYDYKTDISQLREEKEKGFSNLLSGRKSGESTVSISALGETKNVTMLHYELIGPEAEDAMKGMGYGWTEAGDGYISVSSVCPTVDELDDVLVAIRAVSLVRGS